MTAPPAHAIVIIKSKHGESEVIGDEISGMTPLRFELDSDSQTKVTLRVRKPGFVDRVITVSLERDTSVFYRWYVVSGKNKLLVLPTNAPDDKQPTIVVDLPRVKRR